MPLSGRTRSSKRIANGTTTDGPTHDRSTPWATRVRGTGTADRQTGPPACLVDPLRVPCAVPGDLRHVRRFPRSARGVDVAARLGLPAAEQAVPRAGQLPEPVRLRLLGLLRSEEHTSELQSRGHLVCRLLLEKKNKYRHTS